MKKIYLILSVLICSNTIAQEVESIAFLESNLTIKKVRDFTISKDQKEAYFTVQSPTEDLSAIFFVKKDNNLKFENPKLASFSGKYKDLEPFLSPNGLRLYFASNRPKKTDKDGKLDFDIWYVERLDLKSNWSNPINAGNIINSEKDEFYPAIATSGNLYFTSNRLGSIGKDDIFLSEIKINGYQKPKPLSDRVNSKGYEFNSYISQDESYIIFSGYNRKDGLGSGDLYISFRDNIGNWSIAQNLGKQVNSKQMDYCPFVDEDTNTLFFTSKRSEVTVHKKLSTSGFLKEINKYKNGQSRIYKVNIANILKSKK